MMSIYGEPPYHNISSILAPHPDLSLFNHYLTLTGLAAAINDRIGKTLCVVDNAAMEELLSHNPTLSTLQNILSFHILHDYYPVSDLRRSDYAITCCRLTCARTYYERVAIHQTNDGKIIFIVPFAGGTKSSEFRRSIKVMWKHQLSVIQISSLLPTLDFLSPSLPTIAVEDDDLVRIIYSHGCRSFAAAIACNKPAMDALNECLRSDEGLTIFCPSDEEFQVSEYFRVEFTTCDELAIVELLSYAVPSYLSMEMLREGRVLKSLWLYKNGRVRSSWKPRFSVNVDDEDGKKVVVNGLDGPEDEGWNDRKTRVLKTMVDSLPLALYAIDGVLIP